MARDADHKLLASVPIGFRGDFLAGLDRSTPVGQAMYARFEQVLEDLGGADNIATVRRSTARDWVALDTLVESLFCRIAAGEQIDIGGLTQLINSKNGLARIIGLDRRPKRIRRLAEVMAEAERQPVGKPANGAS